MNSRRAANRAASRRVVDRDSDLRTREPETHEEMRGRRIPHRDPSHHEEGGDHRHEPHASWGSPASKGASKGGGPLPGAGELPAAGPGAAAKTYAQRDPSESPIAPTPTGAPPKGMKTYAEE